VAKAISLVEDGSRDLAKLSEVLYPKTGRAYTVGLTGSPGVGKSSLAEQLVRAARAREKTVAVLAIDPTSPFSGGALLGDRVRMQDHATDTGVFIRSMATRGHLGGMALAAPEALRILDASGKDLIIVETVGVGQAEVEVASLSTREMLGHQALAARAPARSGRRSQAPTIQPVAAVHRPADKPKVRIIRSASVTETPAVADSTN